MNIPKDVRETHRDLSAASLKFIEYAVSHPLGAVMPEFDARDLPDAIGAAPYPMQPWPAFVNERKMTGFKRLAIDLPKLIKTIPARIFDNDPVEVAAFYNLGSPTIAKMILSEPNGFDGCVSRVDFIDTPDGPKCLEINMSGNIGGWQLASFGHAYKATPLLAGFLEETGLQPKFTEPLRAILKHLIEDGLRAGMAKDGSLNIAAVQEDAEVADMETYLDRLYTDARHETGLDGKIVCCAYPYGLTLRRGQPFCGRMRVDLILEFTPKPTPNPVFRAFKSGKVLLYNGYAPMALNDKRNLALLSEHADSGCFSETERTLIHEFVPWTRILAKGETRMGREALSLPQDLITGRERFVLKKGVGYQGDQVFVGRNTTPERWAFYVEQALAEGGWLVQERADSRPYLFQHQLGWTVHDMVWGLFGLGDNYGGGFLRMMPRDEGTGVINAARGAAEGVFFEA